MDDFGELHLGEIPFVVVDVETTGHNPREHRVTEIACVTLRDGAVIEEFSSLVNPRQHIPSSISRVTGITDAMVWNAPEEEEVFRKVGTILAQPYAVFVAHNASFDWSFAQHSLERAGIASLAPPVLCTLKVSRRLFPKHKKLNLGALASHFEIAITSRHRAFGDASATASVLARLLEILQEEHDVQTLRELLVFQNKQMRGFKPPPRSAERLRQTLDALPDEPGAYYFRDRAGALLYIGKAKSLRQRVRSYFQAGAQHVGKILDLVRQTREIEWKTTGTELSALLLESKEIKTHTPPYNTLIKRYRRYPFLRLGDDGEARDFPRLDIRFEIEDDGAEYFGPFAGRGSAEAVLDLMNRTFKLRKCSGALQPAANVAPCFYHHIKRCEAPCALLQTPEEYVQHVELARKFLSGERDGIVAALKQTMAECSEQLAFEEAALRRNQIKELERVFFRQHQISASVNENNLILALPASAQRDKAEAFFIRHGRLRFQRLVGKKLPLKELARRIEEIYFDGSEAPAHCRKEEIDEIRIIASWVYQHRRDGKFLYVGAMSQEEIAERLSALLYDIFSSPKPPPPSSAPRDAAQEARSYEPFEETA